MPRPLHCWKPRVSLQRGCETGILLVSRLVLMGLILCILQACSTLHSTPATPATGHARLHVPLGISVAAINGLEQRSYLIGADTTILLQPGKQQIDFWYQQSFGTPIMGRKEIIRSSMQQLQFTAEQDHDYYLSYPRPGNAALARQALPTLQFSLLDSRDTVIAVASPGEGQAPVSPVLDAAAQHVAKQAFPDKSKLPALPPDSDSTQQLEALKRLWQGSSEADRESFLRWILRGNSAE